MSNKTIIFILLLFFAITGTMSLVCAQDLVDDTVNASSVEVEVDSYIAEDGQDDILEIDASGQDDAVLEASKKGTFTELQKKIDNAKKGSTIYLTKDYQYNKDFGSKNGIRITKSITIDGKGHAIDGLEESALLVTNKVSNVVLKNIVFKRGSVESLGPIGIFNSNKIKFDNCNFKDNYADYGGAVYLHSSSSSFIGCSFTENYADYGGAVYLHSSSSSFIGCSFTENYAHYGGAVYLGYSSASFDSSNFHHNEAFSGYGGAVYLDSSDSSFVGCNFKKNLASFEGGAVYLMSSSSSFDSCSLYDNIANGGSGAICSIQSSLNILNSDFKRNKAYIAGADIYSQYSMIFLGCSSFLDSYSYGFGGSLSFDNDYVQISDCTFEDCFSEWGGGAVHCLNSIVDVFFSKFRRCTSIYGGAICSLNTDLVIQNDTFDKNFALAGGCIYTIYGSFAVSGSLFSYSYATLGGVMYINSPHAINSITDNLFLYSSAKKAPKIYVEGYYAEIPESGNVFEDIYFVLGNLTYDSNGNECNQYSNVLAYVISNSDEYQNNLSFYNDLRSIFLSNMDFSSNGQFNISDEFWPNNSTVFLNYRDYNHSFVICDVRDFNDEQELEMFLFNVDGDKLDYLQKINGLYYFGFEDKKLFYNGSDTYNSKKNFNPVPLFNPTYSAEELPTFYFDEEYGTPVKNQDIGNNCWAFAGIATLETCLKKITGEDYDFSENNAKNLMAASSIYGLNIDSNSGGYDSMFIGYLTSWLGPIFEESDRYNPASSVSMAFNSKFHIQDISFLHARHNSSDNDEFKNAIYNYGAVSVIVNWTTNNLHRDWHISLHQGIISGTGNWRDRDGYKGLHAISIVGWDDEYNDYDSLGNYAKGAWIFKNSWSDFWEYDGFGYLSYDQKLSGEIAPYMHAYTFAFNDGDVGYQDIYQYDFAGLTDYICNDGNVIYYKNKFVSREDEFLYAFSTYFENPTYFTFSVRINGEDIIMTEDKIAINNSVHYSPAGYHTIPLGYNLTLKKGDEFEIIIKLVNNSMNYVPVCQADELYKLSYPSNVSFISYNGVDWFDLYGINSTIPFAYSGNRSNTCQVACIKAFTSGYRHNSDDLLSFDDAYEIYQLDAYSISYGEDLEIWIDILDWDYDQNERFENFIELKIYDEIYYAKVIEGSSCFIPYDVYMYRGFEYFECYAQLKSNYFTSDLIYFEYDDGEDYVYRGTFSQLNKTIADAQNGSTVILDKNYYSDADFNGSSISINKSLTIDGNGHTLNGMYESTIFKINSDCNVTLKNINFKFGLGAIVSYGNLSVLDCSFTDNSAGFGGGAIYSIGECFILNSTFDFNYANYGGAIFSYNLSSLKIMGSNFKDNVAFEYGGAILASNIVNITDSNFKSNQNVEIIYFTYYYDENNKTYGNLYLKNNKMDVKNSAAIYYDENKIPYNSPLYLVFTTGSIIKGQYANLCRIENSDGNTFRMEDVNVTLTSNNKDTNIKIDYNPSLGGYTFNTASLDYGTYKLTGSLSKYYASNCTAIDGILYIVKKSVLSASALTKVYGTNKKLTVTLKDGSGKAIANTYITIKLNGKTIKVKTNSKGKASIAVKLAPKKYTATITFTGNTKYYKSAINVKVTIKKAKVKIKAKKKTFKLKTKVKKYTITLKNNLGKAMKKTKVTLKVKGKTYVAKTNKKGKATFKIKNLKKKGTFKASIKYKGSKYYKALTKKVKITVKK